MADMKLDMVADMKVDMVADMVADMKVDMVADIVADMKVDMDMDFSFFWAFLGEIFVFPSVFFLIFNEMFCIFGFLYNIFWIWL